MARVYKRKDSQFYYADLRIGGERIRFRTEFKNRRDAQAQADKEEDRLRSKLEQQSGLQLKEAVHHFFSMRDLKPSTVTSYEYAYANILEILGNFRLSGLTPADLRTYIRERQNQGASIVIRRELAFLSSVYSTVAHLDESITKNVVKELDKMGLKESKPRTVWLTEEEIDRLLMSCTTDFHRVYITLAVDTGMRRSELLGLRLGEFDQDNRMIILGNADPSRTKTGHGRVIPLTDRAYTALCAFIAGHRARCRTDLIFESPWTGRQRTDLKKAWAAICKRAGIKGVRIHDLRHTFASRGLNAGVDILTMMSLTGHSHVSSYKRYAHVSTESQVRAIRKLSGHGKGTGA